MQCIVLSFYYSQSDVFGDFAIVPFGGVFKVNIIRVTQDNLRLEQINTARQQ